MKVLTYNGTRMRLAIASMGLVGLLGLGIGWAAWSDGSKPAAIVALVLAVLVLVAAARVSRNGIVVDTARVGTRNGLTGRSTFVDLADVDLVTTAYYQGPAVRPGMTMWTRTPVLSGLAKRFATMATTPDARALAVQRASRSGPLHAFHLPVDALTEAKRDEVWAALRAGGFRVAGFDDLPATRD